MSSETEGRNTMHKISWGGTEKDRQLGKVTTETKISLHLCLYYNNNWKIE